MENKVIDALYGFSHSNNLAECKKSRPKIHAPGLNIMYGDNEGNVAWFATAQLYKIPDSVNTKLIYEVNKGLSLERELLDFNENPQAINPPSNFVYSANNQPDSIAGILYPGYYLPENRGKRIVNLLEPKDDWDISAASEMITDVISSVEPDIVSNLAKYLDVSLLSENGLKAIDSLRMWSGDYNLSSIEATVYNRWIYYLLENTFEDELDEELFNQFLSTHFMKRLIAPLSKDENSVWWDNVNTTNVSENMKDIVNLSFMEAIASLEKAFGNNVNQWRWERVHSIEHGHPIGQIAALRSFFNVGPFPIHGSREVINNLAFAYDATGFYKTTSGPSTRRVLDFSAVENSISILPTGQSGNPLSKHYRDPA